MPVHTTVLDHPLTPKSAGRFGPARWVIIVIVLMTSQWQELGFSVMVKR